MTEEQLKQKTNCITRPDKLNLPLRAVAFVHHCNFEDLFCAA